MNQTDRIPSPDPFVEELIQVLQRKKGTIADTAYNLRHRLGKRYALR